MTNTPSASPHAARERIAWPFVLAGFGCLLVAAHYDNIRGPLLPAVARELGLAFGDSGWFLAVCHVAATLATGMMIFALNRWPERWITIAVGTLGFVTAAWATQVQAFPALMLLAVLVGATISMLGAMSNVLVMEGSPPRHQARLLAALHTNYGLGSMAASWVTGVALRSGYHWSWLYLAGVPGLIALTGFALVKLKKGGPHGEIVTPHSPVLSAFQWLVVIMIALYVAGEAATSMWLSSYLVSVQGYAEAEAATLVTIFFGIMAATRLACFFLIEPEREKAVLLAALTVPLLAFAAGYGIDPRFFLAMGLFGAFFPVLLARVSRRFPAQWRSITVWVMTVMQVTIGLGELLIGKLADAVGMRLAFLVPPCLLGIALLLLTLYFKNENKKV